MQTGFRRNAILLLAFGELAMVSGARAVDRAEWILSPALLGHAGLEIVWQQTLPLKKGEGFEAATLLGDRLYMRSDRNYLWSLERREGEIVFSRSLAARGIPVLGLTSRGTDLISVVGNQLVELDIDRGVERRISDLELSIIAPPAHNEQFFYFGAGDRRLHVFRAANLVRHFKVAAQNDSLVTTVLADENLVVFGTDAGNLVALMADAPRQLWQFDVPGAIVGPVIRDGDSFYFASQDTSVYRVDIVNPTAVRMTWKFQTEAVLDRPPRVTGERVYQYAVGRGLTAIDKRTGQSVWARREGVDLLAEQGDKAFIITDRRTLTVMSNSTGQRLYSVNFAPVTGHVANVQDSLIYVTDDQGRIACLRPVR